MNLTSLVVGIVADDEVVWVHEVGMVIILVPFRDRGDGERVLIWVISRGVPCCFEGAGLGGAVAFEPCGFSIPKGLKKVHLGRGGAEGAPRGGNAT